MKLSRYLLTALLMLGFVPAVFAQPANAGNAAPAPSTPKRYSLGPDSLPQDGVPKGKLEGPFLFKSQVFAGTVRKYWVYVPVQYQPEKPACVLVFQDGQRATNPNGVLRVQNALDNLIHRKEIPVTIGIFLTPGHRGDRAIRFSACSSRPTHPGSFCKANRKALRQRLSLIFAVRTFAVSVLSQPLRQSNCPAGVRSIPRNWAFATRITAVSNTIRWATPMLGISWKRYSRRWGSVTT